MIVIDPIDISGEGFTRAGPATYTNSAGVLTTAAANELRYSYDPADLSAPPVPLIEAAATNLLLRSDDLGDAAWAKSNTTVTTNVTASPDDTANADKLVENTATGGHYIEQTPTIVAANSYTRTIFVKAAEKAKLWLRVFSSPNTAISAAVVFDAGTGVFESPTNSGGATQVFDAESWGNGWYRVRQTVQLGGSDTAAIFRCTLLSADGSSGSYTGDGVSGIYLFGAQLETGTEPTSYIATGASTVTRAADVLGTSTFVYSNVQEDDHPAYSGTDVYGPGERVISAHNIYQQLLGTARSATISNGTPAVVTAVANGLAANAPVKLTTTGDLPAPLVAGATYYWKIATADTGNLSATPGGASIDTTTAGSGAHTLTSNSIGNPVSNATYWVLVGATNQRKMFDGINNTYTERADSIDVVLAPRGIAQGLFLGGVEAADVVVQVTSGEDTIYEETLLMVRNTMGASYYNWIFERIFRRTAEVLLDLPPVYGALVRVTINNPGETARCAMLALGPTEDMGFTQYGIGRDIKDYSTESFGVDGTSTTVLRGYSKGMTLDVKVDNSDFDSLVDRLENYRQRSVVWIGASEYKQTFVYGKYGSFKTIIEDINYSRCSLVINGKI